MAKPKLEEFQKACETSGGILTHVASGFGVSRQTVYNWIENDPDFKDAIKNAREVFFDLVETKIIQKVEAGDNTMLIFVAKTLMKQRGYVERQELSIDRNKSQYLNLTDEQIEAEIARLEKINSQS